MNFPDSFISSRRKDRPGLLALCLFCSVLLHLLVVFLLPYEKLRSEQNLSTRQEPTIVRLVEKPASIKPKEYELDQRPERPTAEPPPESTRLAEQNQKVEKEIAPQGDDVRDQTAQPATGAPSPVRQQKPAPTTPAQQEQRQQPAAPAAPAAQAKRPPEIDGRLPAAADQQTRQATEQTDAPLPSIEQLTRLTPDTLNRINSSERATRERIKQRDDIESGDTVWLNLERGLLISFFRRFRNQIEGVWNYPRAAIENEMQGTLLLKIIVNTKGELLDVELLNSSGSDILDHEAIQAVYRAAPFGPLGKHYPHPDLKIMAHFRYQLSGKYIYGQRR